MRKGLFPMSDGQIMILIFIGWNPKERGIIYLNDFKVSKSLKK